MNDQNRPDQGSAEFTKVEGLALALSYLNDPASVPCPSCGPGTIEVVAYLDPNSMTEGVVRAAAPEGDYSVVLFCHECRRAGALNLSPDDQGRMGPGSINRGDDADTDGENRRAA